VIVSQKEFGESLKKGVCFAGMKLSATCNDNSVNGRNNKPACVHYSCTFLQVQRVQVVHGNKIRQAHAGPLYIVT